MKDRHTATVLDDAPIRSAGEADGFEPPVDTSEPKPEDPPATGAGGYPVPGGGPRDERDG